LDDRRPREGDGQQGRHGGGEVGEPAGKRRPGGEEVGQAPGGHDEVGLEHLDVEAKADEDGAQEQPAGITAFDRAEQRPGRREQDQHQERVDRVGPTGGNRDRGERQAQRRKQAGSRAERAADQPPDQPDRANGGQRLGEEQGRPP
jgi:hypothetical protein